MSYKIANIPGSPGPLDIHANQVATADKIQTEFLKGSRQVCVKSDCQPGKTGAAVDLYNKCAAYVAKKGKRLVVLYIINSELTDLKKATIERLQGMAVQHGYNAHPKDDVCVLNRSEIQKLNDAIQTQVNSGHSVISKTGNFLAFADLGIIDYNPSSDWLLVIQDEAHLAQLEPSNTVRLLSALGIEWGEDPKTWTNKKCWMLCLSATDFAKDIANQHKANFFTFVPFVNGFGYAGTGNLLVRANNRDKTDKYFTGTCLSTWMQFTVLPKLVQAISSYNNRTTIRYVPVSRFRVKNKTEGEQLLPLLIGWATRRGYRNPKGEVFHSKNQNTEKLSDPNHVDCQLPNVRNPTDIYFAIYCRTLSIGRTIHSLESTVFVVESSPAEESNVAKLVQEAGRYNGYHPWHSFPIFVNRNALEQFVAYLNGTNTSIPSGTGVKNTPSSRESWICDYSFEERIFFPKNVSNLLNENVNDLADCIVNNKPYVASGNYTDQPKNISLGPSREGKKLQLSKSRSKDERSVNQQKLLITLKASHPEFFDARGCVKNNIFAMPKNVRASTRPAINAVAKQHIVRRTLVK